MAEVSDAPWDGSPSRWPDTGDGRTANYCRSCAINLNTGDPKEWTQDKCKLPYKFPNGAISRVSVHTCTAALLGARGGLKGVSSEVKRKAATLFYNLYHDVLKEPVPDGLADLLGKPHDQRKKE